MAEFTAPDVFDGDQSAADKHVVDHVAFLTASDHMDSIRDVAALAVRSGVHDALLDSEVQAYNYFRGMLLRSIAAGSLDSVDKLTRELQAGSSAFVLLANASRLATHANTLVRREPFLLSREVEAAKIDEQRDQLRKMSIGRHPEQPARQPVGFGGYA